MERKKTRFVGILIEKDGKILLDPDDQRVYTQILIPRKELHGAKKGDKIVADVAHWEGLVGKVVKVLGKPGEHETEISAILYGKNFSSAFSTSVEKAASEARNFLKDQDIPLRRDFRKVTTFTIDPDTAKDFDDALSIKKLDNGNFEIGIHIADVTHFVRSGDALDQEAARRATSIYMVDRTVPMLPEELSNDLCSLNPGEDKLAFSAVFEMDRDARIKKEWFGKTIISSDKRFTYAEAQNILNKKSGVFLKELTALETLAKKLRSERIEGGSILFEDTEVKVILDSNNKPIDIIQKERVETQKIIEDFMLLANKQVAEFIGKYEKEKGIRHFIYRIHDKPNEEKISFVLALLKSLGYKTSARDRIDAKEINKILKETENKPEEGLVQTAMIRAMSKAIYTSKNIGHFGLGFSYYTHFTSPIRRYPDIMVHRLLQMYLNSKSPSKNNIETNDKLAAYSSQMERVAETAERESIKFKQAEYMNERIGNTYKGVISGVTNWGIYVEEIKTRSEGLVSVRNLGDEYFTFNKDKFSLTGKDSGKSYRLGDVVDIVVSSVDVRHRQINYLLA